jgi:hypothetical protein
MDETNMELVNSLSKAHRSIRGRMHDLDEAISQAKFTVIHLENEKETLKELYSVIDKLEENLSIYQNHTGNNA